MASKLSEDQIRWILTLDASNAEKEIHKLVTNNKQLEESNKAVRKEMTLLEAAGKRESDEYKNLNTTLTANNKTLKQNREAIKKLETQMGLANLTMSQLKKRAQDLQRQLDNTSKSLHPDEYNKLQKQLVETRSKMEELRKSGNQVEESLGSIIKLKGAWATLIGNIYTKLFDWGLQVIGQMKDLVTEGINMAASADGVSRAFEALNQLELLDQLRKATKGTVNDLELMKAAVQANNFRIPLEDMGKYLQFAQLKAQQTGQSVEYMTNSIVTGLGRKSVLILDNLGLSAAEINEQMAKTGDFMSAVASIVDKQLAQAGGSYVSEADKIAQRTVKLQNAQIELGKSLIPIKQSYDETFRDIQIGLLNSINWLVKNRYAIISVAAAITSYIVIQKLTTLWTERNTKATAANIVMEKLHAISVDLSKRAFLAKLIVLDLYHKRCTLATAATELFNLVIKKNPLGIFLGLLTAVGAAFLIFRTNTSKTINISLEADKSIRAEANTFNNLKKTIHDSSKSYTERKSAIEEIQKLVPDYHGSLTKEGKLIKDNSDVLDLYIKRLKLSAMSQITNSKLANIQGQKDDYINNLGDDAYRFYNVTMAMADPVRNFENEAQAASSQGVSPTAYGAFKQKLEYYDGEIDKYNQLLNSYTSDLLKADVLANSTDDHEDKNSKDLMATELKKTENYYKEKLLKIKESRTKENLTDEELNMANLLAEQDFYNEKLKILEQYYQNEKDKSKKNDIKNQITDVKSSRIDVQGKIGQSNKNRETESVNTLTANRDNWLSTLDTQLKEEKIKIIEALANRKITKEQYDALVLTMESKTLIDRLAIQKEYQGEIGKLELQNGKLKTDAIKQAGKDLLDAELQVADNRAQQSEKFASLLEDFKGEFNLFNQKEEQDLQLKALEAAYKERYQMAKDAGLDTTSLEAAYDKAKTNILLKGEQERAGIRQQYGIISFHEEYELQQTLLNQQYEQGLLEEEEFQQAKMNIQIGNAKKYFDYYAALATNAIGALQQAEMDVIDAKYDVEIEAAKGNAEEIERLEAEKAQKKLDIEKKYADVNFAMKVSQIIADTAVSIMQAFAQLGPIGGAIAAVLMGATGAAQIISANAERQKVKNMTLSGGGTSSSPVGSRVITGKESGGYLDIIREQDKKEYRAINSPGQRGYINSPTVIVGEGPAGRSREWVASNAAIENPTIKPIINLIDSAQRAGTIRTIDLNYLMRQRMAGFSSGGYINTPQMSSSATNPNTIKKNEIAISSILSETRDLLLHLKTNGVNSIFTLTDLEKKQKLKKTAEAPFIRNK